MHSLNRSFKFALHVCDLDETACRAQNNFDESKGMVKLIGKWTNWHGTVCTDSTCTMNRWAVNNCTNCNIDETEGRAEESHSSFMKIRQHEKQFGYITECSGQNW